MMPFLRRSPVANQPKEEADERSGSASSSGGGPSSSTRPSSSSAGPSSVRFGNGFGHGSGGFSSPTGNRRTRWDEGVASNGNDGGGGSRSNGMNGTGPSPLPRRLGSSSSDESNAAEQLATILLQLRTLIAMGIALLCALGLITLLVMLSIAVRPFSKPTYRRLSATLAASAFLDAMALLAPDMTVCLTGDSDVPSPVGASVMVCNHLLNGDWWAMLMLGRCVGLRGSVKVFLRNEMVVSALGLNSFLPCGDRGDGSPKNTLVVSANGGSSLSLSRQIGRNAGQSSSGGGSLNGSGDTSSLSDEADVPVAVKLGGYLLHSLLEFPLLSAESSSNWVKDRSDMLTLLRCFADGGAPAPVHLLLYPEGWSLEGETDRQAAIAKSNEFAKREGRPQLKHLLLPRTKGFNACLESLRESNPIVYDVTMAYRGYDGTAPTTFSLSWPSLWDVIRGQLPTELHFRIKRYSMGEVLGDSQWLDKQWKEKDRALTHFAKYQQFPMDQRGQRGFSRQRVFHTQSHSVESSLMGMARLGIIPFMIPLILFLSIPLCWLVLWLWLAYRAFDLVLDWDSISSLLGGVTLFGPTSQTPRSTGTPFFPATPFASPNQNLTSWKSSTGADKKSEGESPTRR